MLSDIMQASVNCNVIISGLPCVYAVYKPVIASYLVSSKILRKMGKFPKYRAYQQLVRNPKRMRFPQILKSDDSSWGFSIRFSPFAIVFGQKRSKISHVPSPSGGVRDFHRKMQGGLQKACPRVSK